MQKLTKATKKDLAERINELAVCHIMENSTIQTDDVKNTWYKKERKIVRSLYEDYGIELPNLKIILEMGE